MDVKPKKYLGQHFLIDEQISERISEAISKSKKIKGDGLSDSFSSKVSKVNTELGKDAFSTKVNKSK